jgi:hypothetical protein
MSEQTYTKYNLDLNLIQEEVIYMRKRRYSHNVGVLVDDATYRRLIKATDKQEITMSKYIRDLIEQKISEELEEE